MKPAVQNLHNHTPFSDGAYSVDELCEAHLALRDVTVEAIAITDHLFCTPSSRKVEHERDFDRVFGNEARSYLREMRAAAERWAGRIKVHVGCEINWPLNKHLIEPIKQAVAGLDFILFEYIDWGALTQLASVARRFPCPVGLAHVRIPEDFGNTSMDQVVRTMANARLFYEFNSKVYPLTEDDRWFALLPGHRVPISIGTDTHDDLDRLGDLRGMHEFVARRGLSERLFRPATAAQPAATAAVAAR